MHSQLLDRLTCISSLVLVFSMLTFLHIVSSIPPDLRHYLDEYDQTNVIGGESKLYNPSYFIVTPNRIRPGQLVQTAVSILRMEYPQITVTVSVRLVDLEDELARAEETFKRPGTRLLQMKLPTSFPIIYGNYSIRVEGNVYKKSPNENVFEKIGDPLFRNESRVEFDLKQLSVFIQTDKPLYKQEQTVKFRLVAVYPNLMPFYGRLDVFVKDPTGFNVRRWVQRQTNLGVIELSFDLSSQPRYGIFTIQALYEGFWYNKTIEVEEFYQPRFDVNVSLPAFVMSNGFAVAGLITANHSFSGYPVRGNASICARVVSVEEVSKQTCFETNPKDTLRKTIVYFDGSTDLFLPRENLSNIADEIQGKLLDVQVTVHDWYFSESRTGWARSYFYHSTVKLYILGGKVKIFRPGMPFDVYVAARTADGSPLVSSRRRILIKETQHIEGITSPTTKDREMTLPDSSIIRITFYPPLNLKSMDVEISYEGEEQSRAVMRAWRYYTPSAHFITISSSTQAPSVNEFMVFTVKTDSYVDEVFYMLVARGNILLVDSLKMTALQKTFSVAISRDMIPQARIVAYYIAENGHVVVDSMNFYVNATRASTVNLKFNKGKDFSHHTVEVIAEGDPGSLVCLAADDYDMYMRGVRTDLDEVEIVHELDTYDMHVNSSYKWTWTHYDQTRELVYFPSPTMGPDANATFFFAGLLTFSDANVTASYHACNVTLGRLPCFSGGDCYPLTKRCDNQWDCKDGADEMGCEEASMKELEVAQKLQKMSRTTRHFDEFSWAWHTKWIKYFGAVQTRVNVPVFPRTWIISGFTMSKTTGLGVLPVPARYDATRRFYMTVETPDHVRKGDQIGVRIALFNYWSKFVEILVMLHKSDEYEFVNVEPNGYVDSYNPRLSSNEQQTLIYIEAGSAEYVFFPVLPKKMGDVTIKVEAQTFLGSEVMERVVTVNWDGVENYLHSVEFIDLSFQGQIRPPSFYVNVSERFIDAGVRLHRYVNGSPKTKLSVVGDVFGSPIWEEPLTSSNLVRSPYGSGEQAAFNFAVNNYALQYLKSADQLDSVVLKRTLGFMNIALQRILTYMVPAAGGGTPEEAKAVEGDPQHPFTAFSMFRSCCPPSVWLTAFTAQAMIETKRTEYEHILFVEPDIVNNAFNWLCTQQISEGKYKGAFNETSNYPFDRRMLSRDKSYVALTAHVLIAMSSASGMQILQGPAKTCVPTAIDNAKKYLETYVGIGDGVYGELFTGIENINTGPDKDTNKIYREHFGLFRFAIVTHALSLAGSSVVTSKLYPRLLSEKRTGATYVYFSDSKVAVGEEKSIDTKYTIYPKIPEPQDSAAVQTTAYALLVMMQSGDDNRELQRQIVKFLQKMRTTDGGFASTPDTIAAQHALREYAVSSSQRPYYTVALKITSSAVADWIETIDIAKPTYTRMINKDTPAQYGYIEVDVKGTGLAMMQLTTTYNVEYQQHLRPLEPNGPSFMADIVSLEFSGRNKSIMDMKVCCSWTRPMISRSSGLAVLQVQLPTGYHMVNSDVNAYLSHAINTHSVPFLEDGDFDGFVAEFFFDHLTTVPSCVDIRADRWWPVANSTSFHKIRLWDFYEPGRHYLAIYNTEDVFRLNICQVCGSYQCPYCPFYNRALSFLSKTPFSSLLLAICCLFISFLFNSSPGGGVLPSLTRGDMT